MSITNPIVLGVSIDAKTFFLDVNTLLDNDRIINLELQVINEHNWQERRPLPCAALPSYKMYPA